MTATPILSARGLVKFYGKTQVLHDVSIDVAEGEAHVVIGPNGAGKTTLFKAVSGEFPVDGGEIRLGADIVTRLAGWQRVRRGIGRSFQVARIFGEMTTIENLIVAVEARERRARGGFALTLRVNPRASTMTEARHLLDGLSLGDQADRPAKLLSHGDKKRLELAMSLALRPRLIMLDEPTAGMSPGDRSNAAALIADTQRAHGLAFLLTEHDMGVVFGLAQRLTVLHHGAVIATGAPADVRDDPIVKEVYLGHG
ncbi:ABC transporter ATP-binding protein (plasmid) [Tistrella bauzanensis]|uniref:ABC transporter ATP-binding protein n=1 Tax=Tistrella arctica TaxID=3133430 RepID=A0ABU9YPL7_9PROT